MPNPELRGVPWHTRDVQDTVSQLETDAGSGLSAGEARARLEKYGPNRIHSGEATPWWRILLHQFTDPLIYILILAAAVSLLFDEYIDAAVILVVVFLNAAIGFYQEYRARKAIHALAEMTAPTAKVVRDGERHEVDSEDVVPGDLVVLAAGDRIPADARLVKVEHLAADESALTGEAEPVNKQEQAVEDEHAVPGDQFSLVFAGTNVTRGNALGVVVRTGDSSELGQIARATREVEEVRTPIQQKMDRLGKAIGAAVLVLAAVIILGGLVAGMPLDELIRTAVALAVGAVPEALPVVLTVTLANGVRRMAKRNAIIRSLPAVETLGSTTVIGSDKTGTLTSNQMTAKVVWTAGRRYGITGSGYDTVGEIEVVDEGEDGDESHAADAAGADGDRSPLRLTLLTGLLANAADRLPAERDRNKGDPTENALLVSAAKAGLDLEQTRAAHARLDVIPFASERQFMATLNDTADGRCVFVKGSPEAVLARCDRMLGGDGERLEVDSEAILTVASRLADEGYRVLAMALREDDRDRFEGEEPGSDLVFAGLQAMEDPLREEAREAVERARSAGIRVIMLTGDHARTAQAIGRKLGLADGDGRTQEGRDLDALSGDELDAVVRGTNVFARVSPHHKLKLVEQLKAQGEIVAVTGDGVNDAPALQAAHLGVAMGKAGTDVARQASDMVLADDNFASITAAVEEGRVVFSNIRKVTYFLLSTGTGLVLAILSSLIGPWPLPFLATQILWINLVTNGLQDVALAFEKNEGGLLDEPPRDPKEGVLNREVLVRLAWIGLLIAVATVGVFTWMLAQGASLQVARSVAMTQMVMFQFFHVLNARSFRRSLFRIPLSSNPFLAVSLMLALTAHIGALHLPFMQRIFMTVPLSPGQWALVVGVGASIIVASEIDKFFLRRRRLRASEAR